MRRLIPGAFLLLAAACAMPSEQVMCTMEARSAFAVTVLDSVTGYNLAPNATVRVSEGTFSDTLVAMPGWSAYAGVYERAGNYTVSVTHEGYAPWQQGGVQVRRDECHVITEALTARLRPRG